MGTVTGIGDLLGGTVNLVWKGIQLRWSDPTALVQLGENIDAVKSVASTPSQWKYVAGALTPSQREQLARDYETGNGYAVSKAIGERNFNVLATVAPGSDMARGAEVLNDGAKIGKAVKVESNAAASFSSATDKAIDDVVLGNDPASSTVPDSGVPLTQAQMDDIRALPKGERPAPSAKIGVRVKLTPLQGRRFEHGKIAQDLSARRSSAHHPGVIIGVRVKLKPLRLDPLQGRRFEHGQTAQNLSARCASTHHPALNFTLTPTIL